MDIEKYEELTGTTVPSSREAFYTAQIAKTKSILEGLLGYSLDEPAAGTSERTFPFHSSDPYLTIDPFISITSIQIMEGNDVLETIDPNDYTIVDRYGIKKYIRLCPGWCWSFDCGCPGHRYVKVVADWQFDEIPMDLYLLWADMVGWYTNPKRDIKSETLGSHSYTRGETHQVPELKAENRAVIVKYAGGNGTALTLRTL